MKHDLHSYPSNPVVTKTPKRAPVRGDGKSFATLGDNVSAEADTDDGPYTDDVNYNHRVPACEDHPVQGTTTFGATTVNDVAQSDCETTSLSFVHYTEFYAQGNNINNPNVYDNFCKGIDGTINGYWFVDSHGNRIPNPAGVATMPRRSMVRKALRSLFRRTPPLSGTGQSVSTFTVELAWAKDVMGNGCGQTVESCRAAFAKLAQSSCGHQGGEQNSMTTKAKITLPQCGTYSYKFIGADAKGGGGQGGGQTSARPQPAKPTADMKSPPCQACEGTLGASNCKAPDLKCLQDQCRKDKDCQTCGLDCATVGV